MALWAGTASAENSAVSGEVILTIEGAITVTDRPNLAEFDLERLKTFPAVTFETTTIWTEGVQEFTGVPLLALMEAVGAQGSEVVARALNDFEARIPLDQLQEDSPIVAYLRNGEPFALRQNGPLWIVFPYDRAESYSTDEIYGQSVWQLSHLTVKP